MDSHDVNTRLPTRAAQILDALPQTQCTRCSYADCAGYATAIAAGQAGINQCPPGGAAGVERLARITGLAAAPLDPNFGEETTRAVAFVDEAWCIGCTLCIDACPTDAIMGSNKRMHTVIEKYCTGCALCLPVCPVDCIQMENVSGSATGWNAWSEAQALQARNRYNVRQERLQRETEEHRQQQNEKAQDTLTHLAEHSKLTDPALLDRKRSIIEAALARAKARQPG